MKNIFSLFFFSLISLTAMGQHWGVKTNLLYDATTTINLGVEVALGKSLSLDVSGNNNGWTFSDDKQWQNWMVQPEFRVWLCEKFNGHFFGIHALGGQYDFYKVNLPFDIYPDLKDYNYKGDFYGGGLSYGYQWMLGNRWGFELTVGGGYLYAKYDKYDNPGGAKLESGNKNYWGFTKAGITIIYFIL